VVNGEEKRAWLFLDHTQKLSSGKMKNVFVKKQGGEKLGGVAVKRKM